MDKCDEKIILSVGTTVADLAKQTKKPVTEFIRYAFTQGRVIRLNDIVDEELMQLLQGKYGWEWQINYEDETADEVADYARDDEDEMEIAVSAVEKLEQAPIWSNHVWSIAIKPGVFVLQMPKLKALANLTQQIIDKDVNHPRGAPLIVVESRKDKNLGIITTLLIRKKSLKVGDVIEGNKIRAMWQINQRPIKEVKAGEIVHVSGFNQVYSLGTNLTYSAKKKGEKKASNFQTNLQKLCHPKGNLIVRSESESALESVCYFLLENKKQLLSAEVGSIRMQDVKLAQTTKSILVAWQTCVMTNVMTNVPPTVKIIEAKNFEDLLAQLESRVKVDRIVVSKALVKQVFRQGSIAGCVILQGEFKTGGEYEIWRKNQYQARARLSEIKIHKQAVKEVKAPQECGIFMKDWTQWQVDDEIVLYN